MIRKTSLIFLGALAGVAMTLAVTQPHALSFGSAARASASDTYRELNLFGDVFERVRADYVEKPDDSQLVESAINGMLAGLDPHSSYMDPKSFRDMQVQTRGEFGGLGIEVTMEDGLVKVVAPIDDTPAAKAGVMANDIITKLDDEQVQGLSLNQAVDKMRGPVNTKIKLTIVRKGSDKPIEVTIVRDVIRVKSVRSHAEGDDIGYIRITQFNEQTTDGLKQAIDDLNSQLGADKIKGYVIDLRNNPGGLLDQAISVSDTFLEKGEIVSTRGRNPEETQRFNARPGDMTKNKPLIDHEALDLVGAELGVEIVDRLLQAVGCLLVELGDADIADVVAFVMRAHRLNADHVTHDRHFDRLVGALTHDGELDLGVHRSAHLVDRLIQRQTLHRLVVELGDDVVRHDAGLGRRRIVDRRNHLHQAVLHGDLDAEAAELAAGLHLHIAEALRIHVARMWIESGQHAVDCRFDQL